ncbi:type I phosphomannose isomerase catalytic subunit [Tannockella kyphosi]|uniref:type I phosphomannose isomerase catalytic subunit n=1 Tax=Tannockella kyphosi TaxID=2899121 RepID=UPI002013366E|nr:type I phosphomannose isomerase catalytic subunit [Tannockella kyphosi]
MYPLKMKSIYDKTIWANNKLTTIRNKEDGYGTAWEVSAHPYCQNIILNGKYAGKNLLEMIEDHKEAMIGDFELEDMLRVAYLDAKDDLSIQVHPHHDYARKHDNDNGKTESWYILEAEAGATLVAGTLCDDPNIIKKAIKEGNLEQYLRKVPIEKGDFIYIDETMLHALGANIFAIEIGTNSNTTYRFYDYNRKDANGNGRQLHLEKSFDVVDLTKRTEKISNPFIKHDKTTKKTLCDSEFFHVDIYDVVDEITFDTNNDIFMTITFVNGSGIVECAGESIEMNYTQSMFVPISTKPFTVKGNVRLLVGYVNKK